MKSAIKDSDEIYLALSQRKKELELTNFQISVEAAKCGMKLPVPSLSNYFSHKKKSAISEQGILWMCDRYCIKVSVVVDKQKYNEFDAMLKVKLKYEKV